MNRKLPPLNALRAFESSARNESFTRAAQELFVTQGAVSRHVAGLEKWLGTKLFRRTQRGIALTAKGNTYFRILKGALDQIEFGTRQLQERDDANLLRLKLPPTFAIRWLVHRLARFHAEYPAIDVQITTSHDPADFDREDVDVGIHSDYEPPKRGFRRLFGEQLTPVCSPRLPTRERPLAKPADLRNHLLLCSTHRPRDWPAWLEAAGLDDIDGNGGLKFDSAALAYQAAIDEVGVMIAQRVFVEDDLAAGRLVAPLALRVTTPGAYYLTFAADRPRPARVAAFEDWLVRELASSGA
jgi:LysR family glycine cleavage system transcriptional activator